MSMWKYLEGYYCKDDRSLEGIKTEPSRTVLCTISKHYPVGITAKEISKQTRIRPDTVRGSLKSLEVAGFIKKRKYEPSRGRPGADGHDDVRSLRFHIENRNFALNKNDEYQFAPGYTKYTSDFLNAWSVLVDKDQLDDLYPSLMKIVRQVWTKITSSEDPVLKQLLPRTESVDGDRISMQCEYCRINHDARDFIRAILLHILDQFETSSAFMNFFDEQHFISKDRFETQRLPNQENSKSEEQSKEWRDKDSKLPQFQIQQTSPETNIIEVDKTQTKDGINVTLHKVEFSAECTAVFLTLENTNDDHNHRTIEFYGSKCIALQGDYEFKVTSAGPNYKSIRGVRFGTKDYGAVKFERLHYNEPTVKFEFVCIDPVEPFAWSRLFVFEVQIHK